MRERMQKWSAPAALAVLALALAVVPAPRPAPATTVNNDNAFTPQVGGAAGAAQSNAAALPATANRTQYLEGFDITGGGATAASVIEVSITGLQGGTIKYEVPIAAGATAPGFAGNNAANVYSVRFPQALPASAVNTAITVTVPSFGSGNTNASVVAYGYLK